jgi:ATP-binding cassette subfamily C exporter for protease/lipase
MKANAALATVAAASAAPGKPALARSSTGRRNSIDAVLWSFRREVAWIIVFSAFANVLLLTPIVYMLQVFDRVMFSGNLLTLAAVTLFLVFFLGIMAFAEWLRSRLLIRAGSRFDQVLNERVFTAAFAAQLSQHRQLPTQPISDLNSLRQFLTGNAVFAVLDTPWTLVFVGALFLMHPWMGWLSVLFCGVQLVLGFVAHRMQMRSIKAGQQLGLDANRYLQAKFRNAETVEAMGMESNLRLQWMALNDRYLQQQAASQEAAARVQSMMKGLQYTQQGLMLSLGAVLVIEGKLSVGAMVAANSLMGIALRPVGLVVQSWSQFADAQASYRRLNDLLDAQRPQPLEPPLPEVRGQISLVGLSAKAEGRKSPILDGIELEFRAGEVVAILGPSGAGKSTLARCLLGIWPGAEGQVLIDGHDIRSWPRSWLGEHIGYLPQDVELFEGSVADNIARFEKVEPAQVIAAAQAAGIHDMVLRMPKGYDTLVGEAGGTLSGGQRQRLGLARALLREPAIVVLDEPSANLDDRGEAALARAVQALKAKGRTVFMIVHQKSLLGLADRVLVLQAGRVVHFGPAAAAPGTPAAAATQKP